MGQGSIPWRMNQWHSRLMIRPTLRWIRDEIRKGVSLRFSPPKTTWDCRILRILHPVHSSCFRWWLMVELGIHLLSSCGLVSIWDSISLSEETVGASCFFVVGFCCYCVCVVVCLGGSSGFSCYKLQTQTCTILRLMLSPCCTSFRPFPLWANNKAYCFLFSLHPPTCIHTAEALLLLRFAKK